jgi:uncharacterized integral membrane protein (TIGR00698 family)
MTAVSPWGLLLALVIAGASWLIGQVVPVVGAPLLAILIGMALSGLVADRLSLKSGIDFASKKLLQYAIILLGLGLNLSLILRIGRESLLVITGSIVAGLLAAFLLQKLLKLPRKIATLIGVGSAICGGSAIAATAPAIEAEDDDVATAISVVVFFNVLAVFVFPLLGQWLGMSTDSFGIFAGAAINDTSSVTAAATIWDNTHGLGTATLETAVTVKLIRTLAIIPVVVILSAWVNVKSGDFSHQTIRVPQFILWFLVASIVATVVPLSAALIEWTRLVSRFLIVMAMAAIGLKTNPIKLIKTSGRPLFLGFVCSLSIIAVSLVLIRASSAANF